MTAPVTTWASVADVSVYTGATVTDAQLAQAQLQIELRVGRTPASNAYLSASTLRWLKAAVAYQAAWMVAQPDLFTRSEVKDFGAGSTGDSVAFKPDSQMLAPLARRALRRLRWKGTRSTYVPSTTGTIAGAPYPASLGVSSIYDDEDNPAYPADNWRPM